MARYRKIDVRVWDDEKFNRLSPIPPCGRGLWLFLLTNPATSVIPGLFRAGEASLAESIGWPLEAFREAFQEAFREGLVKADWAARVVWIPNVAKYDPPASANVVKSWSVCWDEIPDCAIKLEAYHTLKAFLEGFHKGFLEAFTEGCPEPFGKACRNPEPDPEPDPDHDLSTKRRRITRSSEDVPTVSSPLATDQQSTDLRASDVFALLSTWGGRWIKAIRSPREADQLALELTPFTRDEVLAAKAEAEKLAGDLGFKLLLTKIKFGRERDARNISDCSTDSLPPYLRPENNWSRNRERQECAEKKVGVAL